MVWRVRDRFQRASRRAFVHTTGIYLAGKNGQASGWGSRLQLVGQALVGL